MTGKKVPVLNAREAALRALVRFEQDGAYLNLALPPLLESTPAGERALAVQLAKGAVQRLNTLDWALGLFLRRPLEGFTPWIRNLLRLGSYQLLYLDRVPDYAVVDQSVALARRFGHRGTAGLANAVLRRLARSAGSLPWPDRRRLPLDYLALKHSHPRWMADRAVKRFGFEEAENWCLANNRMPPASFRPNRLRCKPAALIDILRSEGVEAVESPLVPGMLRAALSRSPAQTKAFKDGLLTVQGESSALVAPLLGPRPGDRIVDLCSAPGGKTTHLAELLEDSGLIYAVDIYRSRLRLVEQAALRLGLECIRPVLADGRRIDRCRLQVPAAVLVDAPCSGLGVIRRLPEIKWRRQESELAGRQKLQLELLEASARLLPPGGKLLYAVCSNEPEETVRVVELLGRRHNLIPEPLPPLLPAPLQQEQGDGHTVSLFPHRHDLDGFFIALWRKPG